MLEGKYDNYIINDIEGDITSLFFNAIHGKYKNEKRWISRDMFSLLKDSDPYVRYIWSFGNNGRDYLYGKEIEPLKEQLHYIFFAETPHEARLHWKKFVKLYNGESLESLQSLESLESLERLNKSYDEVEIKPDSVIYCDIPYRNTGGYQKGGFDYEKFYEWALKQENIFISEYSMPDDFECVLEMKKRQLISATDNKEVTEKLFIPKRRKS